MSQITQKVWYEKWRPKTIQECILPKALKAQFQGYVDDKFIPPIILTGTSGLGKSSVAKALCDEIEADTYVVNGSLDANIATLRNEIQSFASTVSLIGGRKMVRIEECDGLSHQVQQALRNFSEDFSKNCGFIGTANHPRRLSDAIWSRFAEVPFVIPNEEKKELAQLFLRRVFYILDQENVTYDKPAVAALLKARFPDFRKILTDLQAYSKTTGHIDIGVLSYQSTEAEWKELFAAMKTKNYSEMRNWIALHPEVESHTLFRKTYEDLSPQLKPETIPMMVIILAEYQHKAALVADQEINNVACMAQIMADVAWK